jgi:hypothetical protein
LYALDLSSFKWVVHSGFDFTLSNPMEDPFVPGQVRQWRQAYCQLVCVNREKNLAARTSNASLY